MKRLSEIDISVLQAAEAEALKGSFYDFVKAFWSTIETAPFIDGWHIRLICNQLEAVYHGKPRQLVINEPPTCCKSRLVSVLWPSWCFVQEPDLRILVASYDQRLVNKFAADSLRLIRSERFRALFPHVRVGDKVAVSAYETTAGGWRISTTPKGRGTGVHADIRIVDDVVKASEARSGRVALDEANAWFGETWSSRSADPSTVRDVIVGQRLHERDLPAHVIKKGWPSLILPLEYEPGRDKHDPRGVEGECLWPERFGPAEVAKMKADQNGAYGVASQLQQRPAPAEGLLFQASWFEKTYKVLPDRGIYAISVDATFKESASSDYVVIQTWLADKASFYLVDQWRGRAGFVETKAQLMAMARRYPQATILVEEAANGAAILDDLKRTLPRMLGVKPLGGKESRAAAVSGLFEAGNVYLPEDAPWLEEFRHEFLVFPMGIHDDTVDACSQGLAWLSERVKRMGHPIVTADVLAALTGDYVPPRDASATVDEGVTQGAYRAWRMGRSR